MNALSHVKSERCRKRLGYCRRIDATAFAKQLAPSLHEIEAVLIKNGQTKAQRTFLLWTGCHEFHKIGSFAWTRRPANLNAPECTRLRGNDRWATGENRNNALPHPRFLDLQVRTQGLFRWRNLGSLRRKASSTPVRASCYMVKPLTLGETVAASTDSSAWLRVWFDSDTVPAFLVNGTRENRQLNPRGFVEFSLADLAVRFPQGGQIEVDSDGKKTLVARFASPLRAKALEKPPAKGCRSLDYILSQRVEIVRPFCFELTSGRRFEFKPKVLKTSELARFDNHAAKNRLPTILVRADLRKQAKSPRRAKHFAGSTA